MWGWGSHMYVCTGLCPHRSQTLHYSLESRSLTETTAKLVASRFCHGGAKQEKEWRGDQRQRWPPSSFQEDIQHLPTTAIHCEPGGLIHRWDQSPEDQITSRSYQLADNHIFINIRAFRAMLPHHNPGETQNHCESFIPAWS